MDNCSGICEGTITINDSDPIQPSVLSNNCSRCISCRPLVGIVIKNGAYGICFITDEILLFEKVLLR